jgi:hypothetical protein
MPSVKSIFTRRLPLALNGLNYTNPHTGTHKAGNHAFLRRFRNTYPRNYTECPEGLYKYWMGHARRDMSDLYDKVKEGREVPQKVGGTVRIWVRVALSFTECTENCSKNSIGKSSVDD